MLPFTSRAKAPRQVREKKQPAARVKRLVERDNERTRMLSRKNVSSILIIAFFSGAGRPPGGPFSPNLERRRQNARGRSANEFPSHRESERSREPPRSFATPGSPIAVYAGMQALNAGGTAADAAATVALTQIATELGSYVSYAGVLQLIYFDAKSNKVTRSERDGIPTALKHPRRFPFSALGSLGVNKRTIRMRKAARLWCPLYGRH